MQILGPRPKDQRGNLALLELLRKRCCAPEWQGPAAEVRVLLLGDSYALLKPNKEHLINVQGLEVHVQKLEGLADSKSIYLFKNIFPYGCGVFPPETPGVPEKLFGGK